MGDGEWTSYQTIWNVTSTDDNDDDSYHYPTTSVTIIIIIIMINKNITAWCIEQYVRVERRGNKMSSSNCYTSTLALHVHGAEWLSDIHSDAVYTVVDIITPRRCWVCWLGPVRRRWGRPAQLTQASVVQLDLYQVACSVGNSTFSGRPRQQRRLHSVSTSMLSVLLSHFHYSQMDMTANAHLDIPILSHYTLWVKKLHQFIFAITLSNQDLFW